MENWQEETIKNIDNKLDGFKEQDLRFYRIDEFKRNICRVDNFSCNCDFCKSIKPEIDNAVSAIDDAILKVGAKRRAYDKLISRLAKHIKTEHGYYPPYYFSYLYAFFGTGAGAVLGLVLMQLNNNFKLELFLLGFAIPLVATYFIGASKDSKIRKEKRLM